MHRRNLREENWLDIPFCLRTSGAPSLQRPTPSGNVKLSYMFLKTTALRTWALEAILATAIRRRKNMMNI